MNVLGDILNTGDNVEYKEDYGFTTSFVRFILPLYMNIHFFVINVPLVNLGSWKIKRISTNNLM